MRKVTRSADNHSAGFRIAALPVVAVLLAFGCGGGDLQEIVLWENLVPHETAILDQCVERFNRDHDGVRIVHANFETENLRTQFLTAALAGEGPDLIYGPADQIGPLAVAGTIAAIDTVLESAFLDRFLPESFDTLNGHIWSLPARVGNHLTLLYNREWIEEPPNSLRELVDMARENTRDVDGDGSPDRYGIVFNMKEPYWLVPFIGAWGGWVMDEKGRPTLDDPATVKALRFVRDLVREYRVSPAGADYNLADTIFKEGKAAMLINGPWSWGGYGEAGVDFGLATIPINEETGLWPTPMISTFGYSVNANIPDRKMSLAREVLRYLTSEEVQLLFAERILVLPSRRELHRSLADVGNDRILASLDQYRRGRRMPVVPEMRAIWDAMRPGYQNVINGEASPEEAAKQMQIDAEKKIREMRG